MNNSKMIDYKIPNQYLAYLIDDGLRVNVMDEFKFYDLMKTS
jgi:hypothetical protein